MNTITLKDRLATYLKYKNTPIARFEKIIGVSNGYVRGLKSNIGADKVERIIAAYPDLSRVWLLTGEGEMLKGAISNNSGTVLYGDNHGGVVTGAGGIFNNVDIKTDAGANSAGLARAKAELAEAQHRIKERDTTIAELKQDIAFLKEQLATKDKQLHEAQERLISILLNQQKG